MSKQQLTKDGWCIFSKETLSIKDEFCNDTEIKISSPSNGGFAKLSFLDDEVNQRTKQSKIFALFRK